MIKYFNITRISLILMSIGILLSRLDLFENEKHTLIISSFLIGLGMGLSFAAMIKNKTGEAKVEEETS
jgi:hypothetical protein